jgi:hypothetical protein
MIEYGGGSCQCERLFYASSDIARRRAHSEPGRSVCYSLAASEQRSKMTFVPKHDEPVACYSRLKS